jgi:membrane protein DedA with SNARE-associated domain
MAVRQTDRVSLHEVEHLVHQYGYAIVFVAVALQAVGAPVPGGTAIVAAALYAATSHGLSIVGVIVVGALGATIGAAAGYAIGRWRGEQLLVRIGRRLRQSPERVQQLRNEFARRGVLSLFVCRFITGLRNIAGLLAGATGMPLRRFLPVTAAAATVWALINALEYYYLGHALTSADTWVQIALLAAGLLSLVITFNFLRRRALRRLQVPDG